MKSQTVIINGTQLEILFSFKKGLEGDEMHPADPDEIELFSAEHLEEDILPLLSQSVKNEIESEISRIQS